MRAMSVKILANTMKTRSQAADLARQTEETFTAEFFDQSSKCWMENKKRKKNGEYVYKPDKINAMPALLEGGRKKKNSKK